jgi:hypothetical protein
MGVDQEDPHVVDGLVLMRISFGCDEFVSVVDSFVEVAAGRSSSLLGASASRSRRNKRASKMSIFSVHQGVARSSPQRLE